jgi:HK97 family phage prohead protease
METKSFEIAYKTQAQGKFVARLCTWNVADATGDVIRQGSFLDSIERSAKKNRVIPVIFNHNWDDVYQHVGEVDPSAMYETAEGLEVSGRFYINEETAAKVFRQLERRALAEWSMGFTIQRSRPLPNGGREITQAHLLECGPCVAGKGQTETISVCAETVREERARLLLEVRRRQLAAAQLAPFRLRLDLAQRRSRLDRALQRT